MTVDGRKSPVHVHVDRETPVHVHLKKGKKAKPGVPTAVEKRLKSKRMSGFAKSSGPRRSKKSASPPFVPPPGRTSKRPLTWEASSHRLEISPPVESGTLKMADLSTSEEEDAHGKMRSYEKRIGNLMSEVGMLKNEMDLQRVKNVVERKDEQLDASRRLLEVQEDELLGYKHELKTTVKENEALRHSVEKFREDADISRSEAGKLAGEKSSLLKKLVEVEMDGKAAGEQLQKLRDTVRKLKEDKRMSAADTTLLTRQREMLMQKLDEFERTNKGLRRLLREHQHTEGEYDHMRKQQDVLLKRLTQSDTTNERLQVEVAERDRQIETLLTQVEADKDQALAFEDLKKTMETTRAHLQNQLRSKEMECGRLAVQIRNLEEQLEQGKLELEHLQGLLAVQREKNGREKEALKKAARLQKDRVGDKEKDIEILKEKLDERELELSDCKRAEAKSREEKANAEMDIRTLKSRVKELQELMETTEKASQSNSEVLTTKLSTRTQEVNTVRLENEQLKADIAALEERLHEEEQRSISKVKAVQSKMAALITNMKQYDEIVEEYKNKVNVSENDVNELQGSVSEYRTRVEEYKAQNKSAKGEVRKLKACTKEYEIMLQEYKDQIVSYEAEINNLRASVSQNTLLLEDHRARCNYSMSEMTELRGAVKQYEELIKEYKVQIDKYRREAEDAKSRLYEYEADTQRHQQESAIENEKVKMKMQQRLSELEPLADLLKSTDARLQESQERIFAYERRSGDHTKLISELTQKVEVQTDQLEHMREKMRAALEENRSLQAKSELIERKLIDSDQQNRELIGVISKKEEAVYQSQQRHEDLRAENIRLNQQLESSLAEARRQADSQREKALVKERAAQARITDLEAQLSRATASAAQLKRSKDEAERRYNSKLYDMRDRLDQANSTTRSMQNYVSFLKSSYANVFDELESPR